MGRVSTPLVGLLVATLVFFALWTVALKPSSSSSGGGSGAGTSTTALGSDIAKAHGAVSTANAASARAAGGSAAGAGSGAAPTTARPAPATSQPHAATGSASQINSTRGAAPIAGSARAAAQQQLRVEAALQTGKVIALLMYNPAGSADRAVRGELASVPTHGGRVVKLAVPLSEITGYSMITSRVAVNGSPTLVIIGPDHAASTLVGFADRFAIAQRIQDALAVH